MTINRATITEAAARIAPFIRRTPVMDIAVPASKNRCASSLSFSSTPELQAARCFHPSFGAKIPKQGIAAASGAQRARLLCGKGSGH